MVNFRDALVIDKKVVFETAEGFEAAWLLIKDEAHPRGSRWVPRQRDAKGKMTEPKWMPLPGSQYTFLECPIFEALYEGTRGPGKTLTLVMDFAQDVGKGYGKAWRGVLFRQKLGDLDDVVRKLEDWLPKIFPGFRFRKSKADYAAVWPTGEELLLRHMEDERTYGEYHGHEYPWIGWEELTQWPMPTAYKMMMTCCRQPSPGVPTRIRASTNPFGPGHNWVRRRFEIKDKGCGEVIRKPGEMPRVAIHGDLSENFVLLHDQPEYPIQVREGASSPAQQQAWLYGRWDITAGGMIDDIWSWEHHVLPEIPIEKIPRGWTITRAYDHGQSAPFAVGWFLQSNGEPITIDYRLIGNVRGDIILWNEWYGTTGETNEGVRLPARKIASGIYDREVEWGLRYPGGRSRVYPGPADSEIFNKISDRHGRSPADDMEDEGIDWERADKSSGSRKRGWEMLRTKLANAVPDPDGYREEPGFFVCNNCFWWLELCPPMPRDDRDMDEVPSTYEDHMADMTRYRLNWEIPGMYRKTF